MLMMDVENNGRPPLSWRCFCDVHTCRKREAMIWRVPKARANAGGRRCHAGPGFAIQRQSGTANRVIAARQPKRREPVLPKRPNSAGSALHPQLESFEGTGPACRCAGCPLSSEIRCTGCAGTHVANSVRLPGQIPAEDAEGGSVGSPGPVDSTAAVASPALSAFASPLHFRPNPQ